MYSAVKSAPPASEARHSRRQCLALLGLLGLEAGLAGCGGGGGGGSAAAYTPPSFSRPTERTYNLWPVSIPATDIAAQVNLHAETVNAASLSSWGRSQSMDAAEGILQGSRLRGRSISGPIEAHVAFAYNTVATKVLYERLSRLTAELSRVGYISDDVSARNNFSPSKSLRNPQWNAAMLRNVYHLLRVTGGTLRAQQIMGVSTAANQIRSMPESDEAAISYGIFATAFNDWIAWHANATRSNFSAFYLELSKDMTRAQRDAQLARVDSMLPKIPLSPGGSTVLTRKNTRAESDGGDDSSYLNDIMGFFASTFQGAAETILQGKDVLARIDFYQYFEQIKQSGGYLSVMTQEAYGSLIVRSPYWLTLAASLGKNVLQMGVEAAAKWIMGATAGPIAAEVTGCILKVIGLTSGVRGAMAAIAGAACSTGVGCVVLGAALGAGLYFSANDVRECLQKLNDPEKILDAARQSDASRPTAQTSDVVALTNPNTAECDQLRQAGVGQLSVTAPTPVEGTTLLTPGDTGSMNDGFQLLEGNQGGRVPRTFNNNETAAFNALMDFTGRNQDTNAPSWNGSDQLSFFASLFALLLRREPNTTRATVPAITEAQMLCSAPGFVPMRTTEGNSKNLTTGAAGFPSLSPLTPLSYGVNVNVR